MSCSREVEGGYCERKVIGLLTGPVLYVIWKRIYGGLAVREPEARPINPKTKLAKGDVNRIGFVCLFTGLLAVVGKFFLTWYEGQWGPEYYLEEYEEGFLSNFDIMLELLVKGGAAVAVIGIILLIIGRRVEKE